MALSTPTYAAGTKNTQWVASLSNFVYDQLMDPHRLATPTSRIFLAHKQRKELGPDEKLKVNIFTHDYPVSLASKNYAFSYEDIDNITQAEFEPVKLASAAGTNMVDMAHYRSASALIDHVALKVESLHRGFTMALNYLLFSDWNETVTSQQINISSELSALQTPPEEMYIKNVTAVNQLPYSIPMLARGAVTGYTLGGISVSPTTNRYWNPIVTLSDDGDGSCVTLATTGDNVDMPVSFNAANCKELDLDDIFSHLDKLSEGVAYDWYAACPAGLYRQLRNLVLAQNIRSTDSPLADLGIKSSIEVQEYNVVFYIDPMMTALWPYSIYFYDPEVIFPLVDIDFDPTSGTGIQEWEHIPGTTIYGTSIFMNFNFVRTDAKGVSAMHGYKPSSL